MEGALNGAMRPTTTYKIIHSPVGMVLLGLVARVLYIALAHLYRFDTSHWHVFEMEMCIRDRRGAD